MIKQDRDILREGHEGLYLFNAIPSNLSETKALLTTTSVCPAPNSLSLILESYYSSGVTYLIL